MLHLILQYRGIISLHNPYIAPIQNIPYQGARGKEAVAGSKPNMESRSPWSASYLALLPENPESIGIVNIQVALSVAGRSRM